VGCSSGGGGSADAGPRPDGPIGASTCSTDPLKTGLVAKQTGVSADAFDCAILTAAAKYGEPDPMLIKAVIYGESRFDQFAVGCTNNPCGVPGGWSTSETGCFGLMQVVPACNPKAGDPWLLANGHPNLTKDPGSPDWPKSVFNPDMNVDMGVGGLADNRAQVKKQFPGCTEDQYTLMALGNYSSYGSTKGCTTVNRSYIDYVLPAYREYAMAAGYPARPY
jgi:hypothetical protein